MAIRKIARMGHPVLRQKGSRTHCPRDRIEEIQRLIADMRETMVEYDGIGLAAPQVHESIQLAIIGYESEQRPQVVINPKITVLDQEEQGYWEGCLSVPELRGLVYRPRKIRVDFVDEKGQSKSITAEGFFGHRFSTRAGSPGRRALHRSR